MRHYIKINNLTIRGIPDSNVSFEIAKGEVVAVTGATGTGKSTVVSMIAGIVRPEKIGMVLVDGLDPFSQLDERKIHRLCGIVQQDPDNDIVFDSVIRDIAFGPENIGLEKKRISKRAVSYFKRLDIMGKQKRRYDQLSLSERQRAVLTSVLVMHHDILVLDDAFSMLSGETSIKILKSIISTARKKNQTLIFTSNKYEELMLADRIIQLENGIAIEKKVDEVDCIFPKQEVNISDNKPGVKFGIKVIRPEQSDNPGELNDESILAVVKDLYFSYGNDELISGYSGAFRRGCLYRISGPEASGKSTFLKLMSGILKPVSGTIQLREKIVYGGQLPSNQLFDDSVIEDVMYQQRSSGVSKAKARKDAENILTRIGVPRRIWEKHPQSLSMGEQRLVVLAGVFAADADIIMLDNPFSGLDSEGYYKIRLYIEELLKNKKCVILVD